MTLISTLSALANPNTGRLKWVAGNLAAGNYAGLRLLQLGWLLCNGAVVPNSGIYTSLYPMLNTGGTGKFGALGTLPTLLNGTVPIPKGTNYPLGATGGEISHILTIAEIPFHFHTQTDEGVADDFNPATHTPYMPPWRPVNPENNYAGASFTSSSAGGGASHNNMPPFNVVGCVLVKL